MLDNYNRQINYLRISVTDRCNSRCTYCMPESGVIPKNHKDIISFEQITSVVKEAVKLGISKIRLTGGEPLVRRGILSLVGMIANVNGVEELTMTTNGLLLSGFALGLKEKGLDRINISLDTLDPQKYRQITRGSDINKVFYGINAVNSAGFRNTKINMVIKPGFNENEVEPMRRFCYERGLELQRINHYSLSDINSVNRGFEAERPLPCHMCNRLRLTADGKLKPCLFSDNEIPLNPDRLSESLIQAIRLKPNSGTYCSQKGNWQIGG